MMTKRIPFLLISLFFLVMYGCNNTYTQIPQEEVLTIEDTIPEVVVPKLHDVELKDLIIHKGKIRWNQTLAEILKPFNVTPEMIYALDRSAREVYDVRRLKAGGYYQLLEDTIKNAATHFIFEPDAQTVVIYQLADSIHARVIQKPVYTVERQIAGVVEQNSSVYEAVLEAQSTPLLVAKLVDILAWQVDFFKINAGDRFKVIYDEQTVDGQAIGISKIKGVEFEHANKTYYGIYFGENEGKEDYFDEYGNSMRKTFLRTPLDFGRLTSRFSPRRYHPVLKRYKAHLGTDYAAPIGTPIRSVGDGVVIEAQYGKYNGNYVKIKHNSNYSTQYLHMQKISKGIRPGVKVKQGQTIGFVGQTGLANGPHVCYRFWKNGRQVDPGSVDLPPSEPINPGMLSAYLHHKNVMLHRLDQMDYPGVEAAQVVSGVQ